MARALLSLAVMTFEDEPTRELPSSLRTFTDLRPFRPTTAHVTAPRDDDSGEIVDDADIILAGSTLVLPPISRPISIPAFTRDVAPTSPPSSPWNVRDPLAFLLGATVLASCLLAGTVGIVIGRASTPSTTSPGARAPRAAVILAATDAITEPPLTAPMKLLVDPPAPPAPAPAAPSSPARPRTTAVRAASSTPAASLAPPPPHRPGFQRPASLPRR